MGLVKNTINQNMSVRKFIVVTIINVTNSALSLKQNVKLVPRSIRFSDEPVASEKQTVAFIRVIQTLVRSSILDNR